MGFLLLNQSGQSWPRTMNKGEEIPYCIRRRVTDAPTPSWIRSVSFYSSCQSHYEACALAHAAGLEIANIAQVLSRISWNNRISSDVWAGPGRVLSAWRNGALYHCSRKSSGCYLASQWNLRKISDRWSKKRNVPAVRSPGMMPEEWPSALSFVTLWEWFHPWRYHRRI